MPNIGKRIMLKKVILFAATPRLKALGGLLEMDGIPEVVRVPVLGGRSDLIAAVKKHKDVSAIIIYGGAIKPFLPLTLQEIRSITAAPVLLVLFEKVSRSKGEELRAAGITEILAQYDVIEDREVADVFHEMAIKALPSRPQLRLVQPGDTAERLQEEWRLEYPLQGISEALSIAGELEQSAVDLRRFAASGAAPANVRQTLMLPAAALGANNDRSLIIEPSTGKGPNVTLYGRRFHLSDNLSAVLDLLYCNKGGVVKEQLYALGIQRKPEAVTIAISHLRRRLLDRDSGWQDVVKCINGKYFLDFNRLSK